MTYDTTIYVIVDDKYLVPKILTLYNSIPFITSELNKSRRRGNPPGTDCIEYLEDRLIYFKTMELLTG